MAGRDGGVALNLRLTIKKAYIFIRGLCYKTIYCCDNLLDIQQTMERHVLKNVNNCLNTNIYSHLEISGGQSSNLYLNGLKRDLDRGPEHRESKMAVLCLLIFIILIS